MRLATGYEDRRARIEIVPLIDVVFLLLVFFVYAMLSMVVYQGLRVELPSGIGVAEDLRAIIITISKDNEVSIDGRVVTLQESVDEAIGKFREMNLPVLISGDSGSDLGVAIELLSRLRKGSVTSVSFQVRNKDQSK